MVDGLFLGPTTRHFLKPTKIHKTVINSHRIFVHFSGGMALMEVRVPVPSYKYFHATYSLQLNYIDSIEVKINTFHFVLPGSILVQRHR